jgi:hypothetical protein
VGADSISRNQVSPKQNKAYRRTTFLAAVLSIIAAFESFRTLRFAWFQADLRNGIVFGISAAILWIALAAWSAHRYWDSSKADKDDREHKHGFWYEFSKDFAAPIMVALVALVFGVYAERQKDFEAENQSKAAALREVFTKGNGPDVAFFTAVGERLTVHLQHYAKLRHEVQVQVHATEEAKKSISDAALFDEKAIYFFYGMFRAARVDFLATKGYVLYPRIWMEVAFERLTNHVIERFNGGPEEEPQTSAEEEAALYGYFGASKAMYNASSRHGTESGPSLFDFALMLVDRSQLGAADTTIDKAPEVAALQRGFDNFQKRLRSHKPDPNEIIAVFDAIVGLDDYAFNTLFADWYHKTSYKAPHDDLPDTAPPEFLPYPLETFHATDPKKIDEEWENERQRAWHEIVEVVPAQLRETKNKSSPIPGR